MCPLFFVGPSCTKPVGTIWKTGCGCKIGSAEKKRNRIGHQLRRSGRNSLEIETMFSPTPNSKLMVAECLAIF